ncbi:hypothetical protein [Chryseobacterium sp. 3008163]|uniref:hypothetical protein n=1 Tax=Chryseobacterium sp. 3008163 TaxID=2478663 RepID=UPI001013C526|nr:hypothetical protein [Chryseobacterium sp. 3008163]
MRERGLSFKDQLSANLSVQNTLRASAYLCGDKIKIGREDIVCCNGSPLAFTTGFAPFITLSVTDGTSLVDIN